MPTSAEAQALCIQGATVVTMSDGGAVLPETDVYIRGNRIVAVGDQGERIAPEDVAQTIPAHGKVLMPGLINTHTHSPMTFLRGTLEDTSYPSDEDHKKYVVADRWPSRVTPEDHYWSSLLGISEMIRAGVTTFVDMYHDMDRVAQAAQLSGIRAYLGWEIMSVRPAPPLFLIYDEETGKRTYEECAKFSSEWDGAANGRVRAMIAPHETATCREPWLTRSAQLAEELKLPITIHVAEVPWENAYTAERHGLTPAQLMAETGILNHRTIGAHCVYLVPDDLTLLADADFYPTSCPQAMLKLAVPQIAPLQDMLDLGIAVTLGTDSATTNNNLDLWRELRLAPMLQRFVKAKGEVMGGDIPLRMVTRNAAKAVGMGGQLGEVAVGCIADLILIDTSRPNWNPLNDLTAQLIYSMNSADVETVIIDGTVVMRDRVMQTYDEQEVIDEVNRRVVRMKQG